MLCNKKQHQEDYKDSELDQNPYRDPITGKKLKIANPVNKSQVSKYEMEEYFNCFEEEFY